MKKIFKGMLVAVLMLSVAAPAVSAESTSLSQTELQNTLHKVKSLVAAGKISEATQLPEVKKLQDPANDALVKSLDIYNPELVEEKLNEISLVDNDRKIIEFEDGSFIIATQKTVPRVKKGNDSVITPLNEGGIGSTYASTASYELWGAYKAAEYRLVTDFTIYSGSNTITNTTTAGTSAIFPSSFTSQSSKVVTNNARTTKSQAEYVLLTGVSIGGQPIGYSRTNTLSTTITINYANNGVINFSVNNTYN